MSPITNWITHWKNNSTKSPDLQTVMQQLAITIEHHLQAIWHSKHATKTAAAATTTTTESQIYLHDMHFRSKYLKGRSKTATTMLEIQSKCRQNISIKRFREHGPSKSPIFPVSLSQNEGYSQIKSGFKPGTSRFLCRNHYKTYAGMVYRASTCYTRFKSPKSFVTNSYVVSCRIELAHFGSNPVYGNW